MDFGFHALGYLGAIVASMGPGTNLARLNETLASGQADYLLEVSRAPIDLKSDIIRIDLNGHAQPPSPYQWRLNETRCLIFTSGTTGPAKCVSLTTQQLVFSALGSALRLGHLPGDRWLGCLPLEHMGGLAPVFRTMIYGTTLHLMERFEASRVNALIDTQTITHISVVPKMLDALLDERGDRPYPKHLRTILVGGSKTSQELLERSRAINAPVAVTWGMSETASQVATSTTAETAEGVAWVPPFPSHWLRVTAGDSRYRGRWHPSNPS